MKTLLITGIGGLTPRSIATVIREKYPHYYVIGIDADKKAAASVGIGGTPSFVINGKLVVGALPVDNFKREIDAALKNLENK